MAERFWQLKDCDLFSRVADEDIAWLESRSRMRKLKRGEPIYLPSESPDGVLLVAAGRVKICHKTPDGKQAIIGFVDPGEVFGELSFLDAQERDEYAEAAEKTTLVLIPKQELQQVVQKNPRIVLSITKLIGLRRQVIERRLRNLLFRSNRERVIHLLLELSEKYGVPVENGVALKIRLSHQELASVIGSTRETVTVVLGLLQAEKLVAVARRRIVLLDLKQLADEVSEPTPKLPTVTPPRSTERVLI